MTPEQLSQAVLAAARAVFTARGWDLDLLPTSVPLQRPRQREHGDYASTLALQLAKRVGRAATRARRRLGRGTGRRGRDQGRGGRRPRLSEHPAGRRPPPGSWPGRWSTPVRRYGHSDALAGQQINLEFVSANPTGPVHLGHTRWAAVGDSLRRILAASGAEVTSEYYINDAGARWTCSAPSLLAAAKGEPSRRRTATPASTSPTSPARSWPSTRTCCRRAGAGGGGAVPRAGLPADAGGDAGQPRAVRRALRRLVLRAHAARQRRGRAGARRRCGNRATSTRPRARSGCAPPTSATTRTGCWSAATAR